MPAKKTVAIVGSFPGTRHLIPWHKKYIDFWVFNEAAGIGWPQKIDGVFQLHQPPIFRNPNNLSDKNHYAWLQEPHPYPIYMQEAYPDIPSAVKYPMEDVLNAMGEFIQRKGKGSNYNPVRYSTSSVSWAIGLAICQGYEQIELYGVEMSTDTEYAHQREAVALWAGFAAGRGIKFIIPEISTLFNGLLYGFEGDVMINRQEFEATANALGEALATAREKMNRAVGKTEAALESLYSKNNAPQETKNKAAQKFYQCLQEQHAAIMEFGVYSGAMQENERYLTKCDEMYKAVGGSKAVDAMIAARESQLSEIEPVLMPAD